MGAESFYRRDVRQWLSRCVDSFLDPLIGAVAAGTALASLLGSPVNAIDPRLHPPNLIAAVATIVAAGSLAWRRRWPVASFAVFLVGAVVVSGTFHYIGLLSVYLLLSLYSLARHASRWQALLGLVAGIACFLGLAAAGIPDLHAKDLLLAIALLVAAWAVGEAVRSRRDQQQDQRRDELRAAVTQERLRIARELHDVVAHSMSLIAVQAGVGAHVIRSDPAAAAQSLAVIADTSRRTLDQTRSMLGILRADDEVGTRPPTQDLDDLPGLVQDVRAAGLEVELVRTGSAVQLDPAISLAAYRIVQESLTNVIKHSAARKATVTVAGSDHGMDLAVSDPGPPRTMGPPNRPGHGLVGLDERVRLVGGSLTHGALDGGYCVRARLPYRMSR